MGTQKLEKVSMWTHLATVDVIYQRIICKRKISPTNDKIFHIRGNPQGGAWTAGGEGETAAGEIGDSEEAVSPVGFLHPPDAGDNKDSQGG